MAIIFALVAMLLFGVADAVGAYLSRHLSATRIMMTDVTVNLGIFSLLALLFVPLDFDLTLLEAAYIVGGALGAMTGYILLLQGLARGHAGVVVPIGNAYAVVSVLLGIFVLGEILSWAEIVAIGAVIVGIVLLSVDRSTWRKFDTAALYGVGALICWGLMTFCLDQAANTVSFVSIAWYNNIVIIILLIGYFATTRTRVYVPGQGRNYVLAAIMGAFLGVGFLSFIYAFSVGTLSIVSVIPAASPFVTALLAHRFLGDRLNLFQVGMIGLIVAGIMLLAW